MVTLKKSNGYTLMELLVVIAIIGVLAALIFPVAATAKRRAQEAKCMNNLMQIHTALKQFQLDEHRYPEFIAGPVQYKENGRIVYHQTDAIVPLTENTGMINGTSGGNGRAVALYPEYLTVVNVLHCPYSDQNGDRDRPVNPMTRPYSFGIHLGARDDDSIVEDPMHLICKAQILGQVPFRGRGLLEVGEQQAPFWLYKYSSYDYQKPPKMPTTDEVHYCTSWCDYRPGDPITKNPPVDHQLRWRTPPENTIVTWCSHHRVLGQGGVPVHSSKDIVLYLDGHVDKMSSDILEPWADAWKRALP